MKVCTQCGTQTQDFSNFCTSCGGSDFTQINSYGSQPAQTADDPAMYSISGQPAPAYNSAYDPFQQPQPAADTVQKGNGDIVAGIAGAFLFALIGGLLYFVIYQIGLIAGITGLAIFALANFGFGLFSKGNRNSTFAIVISVAMTIVMILLAEYICLSYEVYDIVKDEGINFFAAARSVPEFLKDSEIKKAVGEDLGKAFAFSLIAVFSNIFSKRKGNKEKRSRKK